MRLAHFVFEGNDVLVVYVCISINTCICNGGVINKVVYEIRIVQLIFSKTI